MTAPEEIAACPACGVKPPTRKGLYGQTVADHRCLVDLVKWQQAAITLAAVTRERDALVEGHTAMMSFRDKWREKAEVAEARCAELQKALNDIAKGMIPSEILNPALAAFEATGNKLAFKEMMVSWMQKRAACGLSAATESDHKE